MAYRAKRWVLAGSVSLLFTLAWSTNAWAQDPFGADLEEGAEQAPGEAAEGDAAPEGEAPAQESDIAPAPAPEDPAPEAEESTASAEASADASLSLGASLEGDASADAQVDAPEGEAADQLSTADAPGKGVVTGSHIRRQRLVADGTPVIPSPLRVQIQQRDSLQLRRQLGGYALPDTAAALGAGGSGTTRLSLRVQPTLVLLNGRRLVSAPYFGRLGADFVDLNQIPITLIDRVETTYGLQAGIYGDGAIGGVVNYVTRRNFDGLEIDLGGQVTDKFDQHEGDVTLTLGVGSDDTGMVGMVSYFNRQPLAATDRDWIGERENRVESLLGGPATFQQLTNFDYPFADPFCDIAESGGHSTGWEVRLRGYGPPETLPLLPQQTQDEFLMNHDVARGDGNGVIDPLETATYCAGDFTPNQDLVLKEERIQTYSTFWHKLTDHTELFGELGYYRTENENRTAPAFPIIRITADPNNINPVWVPPSHADQPVEQRGFSTVEVEVGRIPNNLFIVGRTAGPYNGHNKNTRRMDVWRGVLGIGGDLEEVGDGSVLESWDWEVAGTYSTSESVSRANDTLMDNLATALNSCPATTMDQDRNEIPTTIKERQELGCFNPFYSSVTNNAAIDPLNVSTDTPSSINGFVTTDTDDEIDEGHGVQDGGFICDPNDPNSPPCPAEFDRDGDGVFELAGTPNTAQVIDRITGEQITYHRRTLATVDGIIRGDLAEFSGGGLGFALGGQYRRESLAVDYDAAYNQRQYAFLFGGPDIDPITRDIAAGFLEARLQLADGLIEVQPGVRVEHYQDIGLGTNFLGGVALRPFASSASPPEALEWLLIRGHFGRGHRAPSLVQMYGTLNEFVSVDYRGSTLFVPHQIRGNEALDFEVYQTISGGLQWDFKGVHVAADFWTTTVEDVVAADNARTLVNDCWQQFQAGFGECRELVFLTGTESIDHVASAFDNLAEVDTNGVDGTVMYTLDTKKRGMGDVGTFVVGAQGTFINSYLIKSPRALRQFYRDGTPPGQLADKPLPTFVDGGTRDYSNLNAEYEAAGWRNLENFAPPMPQLRVVAPIRWLYEGHLLGFTARHVGGYNDDSEATVERYGLAGIDQLQFADGEEIDPFTVFDAAYGYSFGDEGWKTRFTLGVLNLLDTAPPEVEGPLGYEVGVHDPRGRMIYARVTGEF